MKEVEQQKKKILRLKEEDENAAKEAEKAKADEALRRHHEQARLLHELERRRQEEIAKRLVKQREALAEARRKEQANQKKLKTMGVCPVGFRWIKQVQGIDALVAVTMFPMLDFSDLQAVKYLLANANLV